MIVKSNIMNEMSDMTILQVLGLFIREIRLQQNKTQEGVAVAAGIKRMTLVRIEKGKGGTMATFVRVLRSLDQLHVFNQFEVSTQISPLKLAKLEQGKRLRARPKKQAKKNNKQSDW